MDAAAIAALDVAETIEAVLGSASAGATSSTVLGRLAVPNADDTANDTLARVVGQKNDTAQVTLGATSSLMRYTKGNLQIARSLLYDSVEGFSIGALSFADLLRVLERRAITSPVAGSIGDRIDAKTSTRAVPGDAMRLDANGITDVIGALQDARFDDSRPTGSLAYYIYDILVSRIDITLSSRLDTTVSSRAAPGAAMRLDSNGISDVISAMQDARFDDSRPAGSLSWYVIDRIDAKTINLPSSPAAVGSAMRLDSNGITDVISALQDARFDDSRPTGSLAYYIYDILVSRIDTTVSSRAAPGAAMRLDSNGKSDVLSVLRDDVAFDDAGYGSGSLAHYIVGLIHPKTTNLPSSPAAVGSAMRLDANGITDVISALQDARFDDSRPTGSLAYYIYDILVSRVDTTVGSRATPSDVTSARDSIKGASNRDLTQVYELVRRPSASLSTHYNGTPGTTYAQVLNVTGRGVLHALHVTNAVGHRYYLKIVVDGTAYYTQSPNNAASAGLAWLAGLPKSTTEGGTNTGFPELIQGSSTNHAPCIIEFDSSLEVHVKYEAVVNPDTRTMDVHTFGQYR